MTEKPITPQYYSNSLILKTVFPLILSLLLEQLIGLTDVIFLGRVGEIELGASALAGVVYLALVMFGFGYSFGLQAYMGQKNGEKDFFSIGSAFHNGALFLLLLAAFMMAIGFYWGSPFLEKICESPEVAASAEKYFFWRTVGIPFTFLCAVFRAFFMATLRPSVLTIGSVVMVVCNVVLNYFLIFGFGPIPALGISGAAIASTISEAVCLLVYVVYTWRYAMPERYGLLRAVVWNSAMQLQLFRLGRWLMIQEGMAFGAWLYFFIAVEHLGPAALAISNVVRQIASLFYLITHGFGTTAGAISANLIGERRFDEISSVCRRTLVLTSIMLAPVYLFVVFFPEAVLGIFTNLTDIVTGGVQTTWVLMGSLLVTVPAMFYNFAMGAMGLTKETSIASITSSIIYVAYIAVVAHYTQDVAMVWSSEFVYNITIGVICAYYFRQHRWRQL